MALCVVSKSFGWEMYFTLHVSQVSRVKTHSSCSSFGFWMLWTLVCLPSSWVLHQIPPAFLVLLRSHSRCFFVQLLFNFCVFGVLFFFLKRHLALKRTPLNSM